MIPFIQHSAVAAPLFRPNIDTDVIIPSREMKTVSKAGLADGAFANWRYTNVKDRVPNAEFVLNKDRFRAAEILVAGLNFGCGSSREHAVWALKELGIRAVLAPSFGAIFEKNCVMNGLVPARLDSADAETLASALEAEDPALTVDLESMTAALGDQSYSLALNDSYRAMLMNGWDAIELTLQQQDAIKDWQARARADRPWISESLKP